MGNHLDLRDFWPTRSIIEVVGYNRFFRMVAITGAAAIVYVCGVVVFVAVLCGAFSCSCAIAGWGRVPDRVYVYS